MSRWVLAMLLAAATAIAQTPSKDQPKEQKQLKTERPQPQGEKEEIPPEEDASLAPKQYSFNPLQSEKEIRVGNYYFHKGSFRAAAGRYREATQWNQGNSEAWLKLAEAEEKARDHKAAKEAYTKYLELAPDAKNAGDIRKRVAKLKLP